MVITPRDSSFYIRFSIILSGIFFVLNSCKKDIPNPNNSGTNPSTNFSQVFENFWNGININYLYWDIDTTNWDLEYREFKPIFDELRLENDTDVRKSVMYFRE